jgi:hypothetical protein
MMATKNNTKGESFAYAFSRIDESINKGFYLEAVTVAESIVSDRLLSYVKSHDNRVNIHTSLKQLIDKAEKLCIATESANLGYEMFLALHKWRINRNKCVHSVAKSEPGEPTITADEFNKLAKTSAEEGKILARCVCKWHYALKKQDEK